MNLASRAREVLDRFQEIERNLADASDRGVTARIRDLSRERSAMEPLVEIATRYDALATERAGLEAMLTQTDLDAELREMAQGERLALDETIAALEPDFKRRLLPPDPLDARNVLIEIRAGTGGEEAALFAADLLRMYLRYAERTGFRTEMLSTNRTEIGGLKEAVFSIEGERVYSRLKYEGGVHRVQRVPKTEASGRIHTSAATVAVLPEADEVDVKIDLNDLRIDVFRSQGPGGQSVNTTDSAVRVTHLPTGIVVSCQDEKSQLKNKNKALRVLRARLQEAEEEKARAVADSARRSMVGSGDRSQRIRTYNFPQGRVTDHRIELTLYALDEIIDGALERLIEPLQLADDQRRLEADAR
jgi:peptide chain release factor 1